MRGHPAPDQAHAGEATAGAASEPVRVRAPVHAASGHRLGSAHPRQDGPPDLRLVPPAAAAWAAAALALGAPSSAALSGVVVCCLAALLVGAFAVRARPGPARRGVLVAVALSLLCAASGGAVASLHTLAVGAGPLAEAADRYGHVTVEVTLTADPILARPRPDGGPRPVVLRADATRVTGSDGRVTAVDNPVMVVIAADEPRRWLALLPSARLRLSARAAPPRPGQGGTLTAVLRPAGDAPPQVIDGPNAVHRWAGAVRADLRAATDGLHPDARALLPALIIGDGSRIPAGLERAVEAADMTHMIVVSGSQLAVVLAVLIGAPGRAGHAERGGLAGRLGLPLRVTAVLGSGLILAFVTVCRPGPSVLRAAVCGALTLLAIATGRRRSLLPALAAAVLLLVLHDPELARSFGFLLSVLATGSLLTIAPPWSRALRQRGVPGRVAEALAVAAATQVVCAPVVAVFAARVSLVGIPCNLAAELALAPVTVLGWAALAVTPAAIPVAEALLWLASWPARWIALVARTGAALPGAELGWPDGWSGAALLAVATSAVLALVRQALARPWLAAAGALLLLLALLRPAPLTRVLTGWPPPNWRLAVCDVGQGDGLVLAADPGTAVVVDTGPDPALMDACLRRLGIDRVALVLLTHHHADHVRGLPGVLRGRAVGAVQVTTGSDDSGQAAFVRRVTARAGVPLLAAHPGERRALGPAGGRQVSWEVLWPPVGAPGLGTNDASVTLLLRTGGLTVFLPGDLEPAAQRRLLARHPALPQVDVLKVAHHGSAHQHPPLLDRLSPRVALISCGEGNDYGHPAPSTLAALRAGGARVFRTDTHGALAVDAAGAVTASGS
ncbi:ComEC/Rec2 family competence protein [Streptomyces sp. JJ66]|uniref:ComEC/Rec2 family competence protein n=1 Tax=Streptomyces sp. JJ66 TaxID=2803843 RepID=UPI001C59FBB1|nr:ComEC/Rec2 family competence protein [Streptomyces sp. JJ66]MBW1601056.1 ComEC/Rec2 family competence protein [Streptomyces sp. JJ66]